MQGRLVESDQDRDLVRHVRPRACAPSPGDLLEIQSLGFEGEVHVPIRGRF